MTRNPSAISLLLRVTLVLGLLCALIFTQAGLSQSLARPCGMQADAYSEKHAATVDCRQCCAAMPCCLASKHTSDAPARPEPLNHERNHPSDHAPVAAVFTPVPTFDFFASPQKSRRLAGDRMPQPARLQVARGAVSCIWLI